MPFASHSFNSTIRCQVDQWIQNEALKLVHLCWIGIEQLFRQLSDEVRVCLLIRVDIRSWAIGAMNSTDDFRFLNPTGLCGSDVEVDTSFAGQALPWFIESVADGFEMAADRGSLKYNSNSCAFWPSFLLVTFQMAYICFLKYDIAYLKIILVNLESRIIHCVVLEYRALLT